MEKPKYSNSSIDWLIYEITLVERNLYNKDWIKLNPNLAGNNLIEIIDKARAKYEKELKEAYEKGFDEGVKHINQLIMSDEKFPF
jgi:hypothetical protein